MAAKVIGPSLHNEACKVALAQSTRCILSPEAMVEVVLILRSPNKAFQQVWELMSLQKVRYRSTVTQLNPHYYVSPLCTRNAFDLKWKELLTPLQLDPPTSTTRPRATAVVWALESWIRYLFSRPALIRQVERSFPLTLPCGGQFMDQDHHLLGEHGLVVSVPCQCLGTRASQPR